MIALLLLAAAPGAYAARTCGYDFYGRYRCSGLSNAARLGIGIGIAALSVFVLLSLVMLRRRRARRINEAYITHTHPQGQLQPPPPNQPQPSYDHMYQQYNPSQNQYPQGNGAWNAGAPVNYPPNNQSQYTPPPGPPPPGYAPPNHPPPTKEHV